MDSKYDQKVANFWDRESWSWGDKYRGKTSYFYRCRTFYQFFQSAGLQQATILDYGCGAGDISFPMLLGGHSVVGVDIAAEMIKQARGRVAKHGLSLTASFHQLNDDVVRDISSRKFDVIICSSVLEYVPDDMSLVRLFDSLLKKGGVLLISVPDKRSLCCKLDKWIYSHRSLMPGFVPVQKLAYLEIQKRQYDIKNFIRTVEQIGFDLVRLKYSSIKLQRGILMEKVSNIPGMGMLAIMMFRKRTQ